MWHVLVVEDDPLMREFFALSVSSCDALTLAGSVGTVADAFAWLENDANTVDVLLTDLGLPDGSGLDVIRHALRLHPRRSRGQPSAFKADFIFWSDSPFSLPATSHGECVGPGLERLFRYYSNTCLLNGP